MNPAYIHLVVNHFPIVGLSFAIPLLLLALLLRSDRGALHAAVLVLVMCGVTGFAAHQTGERSEEMVEKLEGVEEETIEEHEERADVAQILVVVTALAAIGLWVAALRLRGPVPAAWLIGLLLLATASSGAMVWTSQAGGVIRHTEIRGGFFLPPGE